MNLQKELPQINYLIVDDTELIRNTLRIQLEGMGVKSSIFEAERVDKAWSAIKKQHKSEEEIQFIICDWIIPGKNGSDFLEMLKSDKRFNSIPFLFLTSVDEKVHIYHALRLGANGYLTKPWSPHKLKESIIDCWEDKNKQDAS